MDEPVQPSRNVAKPFHKWFGRLFTGVCIGLACLTHLWSFRDNYVPAKRSDRKPIVSAKSVEEILTIEQEVAELWKIIESKSSALELAELRPPASAESIAELENMLGSPLPVDFKASLRIHNGNHSLLSVEAMLKLIHQEMRFAYMDEPFFSKGTHPNNLTFMESYDEFNRGLNASVIQCDTGRVLGSTGKSTPPHTQYGPSYYPIGNDRNLRDDKDSFLNYLREAAEQTKPGKNRW